LSRELDEFASNLRSEVLARASAEEPGIPVTEAFTEIVLDDLCAADVLDEANVAVYRARGVEVHGYARSDDGETLSLITAIHLQKTPPGKIYALEVENATRRLLTFYRKAATGLAASLEESTAAFDLALSVQESARSIRRLRLVIISDAIAVNRDVPKPSMGDLEVTVEVWDLTKIHRLATVGKPEETIDVNFVADFGGPIPCLPVPSNSADYKVHLAVVPGSVLAEVYRVHGTRLLERNVRAYLQARGAVNRGIRQTILDEPERFLAYNNGITATVSGVEVVDLPGGGKGIASITDLQIVNGGQTTASLHHLAHRDRERQRVDLGPIYVQAKFAEVPPETLDEMVPLISQYANSQNKVNTADFQANAPFHVELEQQSRTVWATPRDGGRMTHWFYERARGQYNELLAKQLTSAKQREFRLENPGGQKFTKVDVAIYEHSWDQYPHLVGLGREKNFRLFTLELSKRGRFVVDAGYFKRLIAKAILFNATKKIVARYPGDFKSNVTAYTVAYVSHLTSRRIDLDAIWAAQDISPALADLIDKACVKVRDAIVSGANGRNVTEWCKKEDCWSAVRAVEMRIPKAVERELAADQAESYELNRSVIELLERSATPLAKSDILAGIGAGERVWNRLINGLISSGHVVKIGDRRTATYCVATDQ
jgi:hypothetical protein